MMEKCTFCGGVAGLEVRGRRGDALGHWANSCAECLATLVTGSPNWTSFEFRDIERAEQNVLAEGVWLPWEERVRALEHREAVNKARLDIQGCDLAKLTDRQKELEERHKGWFDNHRDLLIEHSKRIRELERRNEGSVVAAMPPREYWTAPPW